MKSVLISIRPKRCEKICHEIGKDENGKPIYEKRIEVRKSAPKEVPFKVYIYCTKEKPFIQKIRFSDIPISYTQISKNLYNGKVIGEFVCYCIDRVEIVTSITADYIQVNGKRTSTTTKDSCLSFDELQKYTDGKPVYGWHISDLKIYDKPLSLSELGVNHPPQSEKSLVWEYGEGWFSCWEAIKKAIDELLKEYEK